MHRLIFTCLLFVYVQTHAQKYGTGLIFNDANYAKAKVRANFNSRNLDLLPGTYSLKKYCPTPGNQMQLNTSPAWATAWSAISILEAQAIESIEKEKIDPLTLSPPYLYQNIRASGDQNCANGIDLFEALEFIRFNKLRKFDEFQEFCPKYVADNAMPVTTDEVRDFRKLFDDNDSKKFKINVVKKSISQNLPVVIGMHCPPSFFSAKDYWNPTEMMSRDLPGHALCVVGYDDEKYGGAFEVINSWGREWGNNGFMWITYNDFVNFTRYAYEVFYVNAKKDGHKLSGSVQLKLNSERIVPLEKVDPGIFTSSEPFHTGTFFRIYLKNEIPAFVYVFGVDAENRYFRIFPDLDHISPALVYSSDELAIPGEDKYIEIIDAPGKENLCILYSKTPIDINHILENLSKYPGSIQENLDALLNGKIISPQKITWKSDGIEFNSFSEQKSAIFIQIQINHI